MITKKQVDENVQQQIDDLNALTEIFMRAIKVENNLLREGILRFFRYNGSQNLNYMDSFIGAVGGFKEVITHDKDEVH
jgi:hypothetical protein